MTYFQDMTKYTYWEEFIDSDELILNVGWLSKDHPFTKGKLPISFHQKLDKVIQHDRVMETRGSHPCEFCDSHVSGNGEIWVRGRNGTIFAAPVLILHYIKEHDYLPPQSFIDAVERL